MADGNKEPAAADEVLALIASRLADLTKATTVMAKALLRLEKRLAKVERGVWRDD